MKDEKLLVGGHKEGKSQWENRKEQLGEMSAKEMFKWKVVQKENPVLNEDIRRTRLVRISINPIAENDKPGVSEGFW